MLKSALLLSIALAILPHMDASATRGAGRDVETAPSVIHFTLTPDGERAQFSLASSGSQSSDRLRWEDFDGLSRADVAASGAHGVRFRSAREAGVFTCSGIAGVNTASGSCRFAGDASFAAALAARGIGQPSQAQIYYLALGDFHIAMLDELDRQAYARPNLDDVVQSGLLGLDADYVRGMAHAGYRLGTLDQLSEFQIHGVTPAYIADVARLGPAFQHLAADDLMALAIAGVTPEFVNDLRAAGYGGETPEQYAEMRLHGATAAYARELAALGFRSVASDKLVEAAIFGVDVAFVRGMREAGYERLTLEELIDLRIHDVSPRYAARMNAGRSARQHN